MFPLLHHGIVAKNVALAGVKSVTVYDPFPVEIADLGTQVSSIVASVSVSYTNP